MNSDFRKFLTEETEIPKLLLVGSGSWSAKLYRIFETSSLDILIHKISMGDFLKLVTNGEENLNNIVIWICSRPDLQLQAFEKLNSLNQICKLVLEKPIARNNEEFTRLKSIIFDTNIEVYLSEPWSYSSIWKDLLNECKLRKDSLSIASSRTGRSIRSYLIPPQDWIPHDLYLLADIAGELEILISRDLVDWSNDFRSVNISGNIGDVSTFSLTGGFADTENVAKWEIKFMNGDSFLLDFLEYSFYATNNELQLFTRTYKSDQPLLNQLKFILGSKPSENLSKKIDLQELILV